MSSVAGPPPIITVQPTNQTVQVGDTATFVVQATSGTTLSYQWYSQTNAIAGATNNLYTRSNAQLTNAGVYYAAVRNADGTVISTNATLTVVNNLGLKGSWRFDGNADDFSGNNYHGTLTNGALINTIAGSNKIGPGKLSLDGVNDFVDLAAHRNSFATLTKGTIAAWIKTATGSGVILAVNDIADADATSSLRISSTGYLTFDVWENNANVLTVKSVATVHDNTWHHVAVTVDSSGNKLYIDGAQAPVFYDFGSATSTNFFSAVSGVDVMQIGCDRNSAGPRLFFNGLIDDVRVYDRALSASDIAGLYTVSVPTAVSPDTTACVTATNIATRTWSHTVSGGSGRILIVGIALADTAESVSSVTYAGTALTRINSVYAGNTAEIWFLLAPPVGTANIVATWTGNRDMAGWSGSFTNVNHTDPIGDSAVANGNIITPSVTVSAAAGDLVVDTLSANGDALSVTVGAGQTQICSSPTGTGGSDCWGLSSHKAGAASVTMSWSQGAAKNWGIAAAVLQAAPAQQADVAATVTGSSSVVAGANLTYTLTVTNAGPNTATNLVVTDTLPGGAAFFSASSDGTSNNGAVTWPPFNLASGASTNFTLTLTAPPRGTLINTVSCVAATYDPESGNNDGSAAGASVVTTVPPIFDARLAESSYSMANDATTLTWSQTVNSGSSRMLIVGLGLRLKSSIVTSVTYSGIALTNLVSSRGKNAVEIWGLVAPPVGTANVVVNWSGLSDLVGWSGVFTNVNQANPVGDTGASFNTSATPGVTVNAAAGDLVVDTVSTKGDALTLTPGAGETGIFADGLGTVGADGRGAAGYEAGAGSTTMSWTMAASKDWDIAAVVLKSIPAPAQADVVTTVTGPINVFAASNLTYSISVANLGPSAANNLVVSDTLPVGVAFVSASGGGAVSNGIVRWTIASLGSTSATNFTLAVTSPPTGPLTNTVASAANTSDPDSANNNGTAPTAKVVTVVYPRPALNGQWMAGSGFQVEFTTLPNTLVSIEASTNLVNWQILVTTNSGNGAVGFLDQAAPSQPKRFYRGRQSP